MSSEWAMLEALAAEGDPSKFRKCVCALSDHAGWTLDPAKKEELKIDNPEHLTEMTLKMGISFSKAGLCSGPEDRERTRTMLKALPALLEKNASYRIPHSAEEERRRFRQDIRDILQPVKQLGFHRGGWTYVVDLMDDMLAQKGQGIQNLVWHYDPRLQLVHFPSFRCFIEAQVMKTYLGVAQALTMKVVKGMASPAQMQFCADVSGGFKLFPAALDCIGFYAVEMGLDEEETLPEPGSSSSETPAKSSSKAQDRRHKQRAKKEMILVSQEMNRQMGLTSSGSPEKDSQTPGKPDASAEEASEAGPSLTKTQRKHAKQKANKAAARLAKEAAASTSRSDYLPKMPIPMPPTVAPKKKKAASSASTGEAVGGSWAVVESGEPREAFPEPETGPEDVPESESAAEPEPRTEETTGEGGGAETEASAPDTAAVAVEEASVAPATRQLPVVEAVGPSGAYAVLAHDLARIADRLRKIRLAKP